MVKEKIDDTYTPLWDGIMRNTDLNLLQKVILAKCMHLWRNTHKLNFSTSTMAQWLGSKQRTIISTLHSMSDNEELNGGLVQGDADYLGFFHIVVCGDKSKKTANTYILNEKRINEYFGIEYFPTKPPIYSTASPTVTNNETKAMCAAEENEQQTIQIKKFNKVDRTKIHNDRQDSKQDRAIERESGTSIR